MTDKTEHRRDSDSGHDWLRPSSGASLDEVNNTVRVPAQAGRFRKFVAFAGPGSLVAVGYVDPGNWATSIAGGSRFAYTLLSVILIANLMAMLLQALSAKLGIVTGKDLAQATRDASGQRSAIILWLLAELAIIATDLAEVIGSAIALNLLFNIPLLAGIIVTTLDVLLFLLLQKKGFRIVEAVVAVLMTTIFGIFVFEVAASQPDIGPLLVGYLPHDTAIVTNPDMLFIALGILGATVMPHNLYLHSSIVQTRQYQRNTAGRREAIKYSVWDSTISLTGAFFINSAMLILGAAAFYGTTMHVAEIQDVYKLLSPALGVGAASTLLAIGLLASGQNSTITGTLTGQIVMEGFIHLRIPPWLRRVLTRLIAVIPALAVTAIAGPHGTGTLLLWSQVILSLQIPFAVIPLVKITSNPTKMGHHVNKPWTTALAWTTTLIIVALNAFLLGYIIITRKTLD